MNTASLSTALGSDDPSSDKPDILVPLDPDGNRITWPSGSNPAYLPGIRYELGEYYKRKGLFQPLLEHRAVSLSNGKIAVETVESVKFLSGLVSSAPHSFDAPCPPSPQRIAEYDAAAAIQRALGRTTPALADITIGPDISTNFFINKYQVAAEDARLLTSIGHIFEDSSKGSELLKKAGGSGLKMLELLAREETKVKPKDVTLVRMQLSEYTRAGVSGELTLDNFGKFLSGFDHKNRFLAPGKRMDDGEIVEVIHNLVNNDTATRDIYELKLTVQDPGADREKAEDLVREMLRSRLVSAQLDGTIPSQTALVADPRKKPVPPFRGGGGGGSGGGGGGGGLFGSPGEDPREDDEKERAEDLRRNLIEVFAEPNAWGRYAEIRFYQGAYIVRAPDWVHRAISGYPFAPAQEP